jgi:hypothetical protein
MSVKTLHPAAKKVVERINPKNLGALIDSIWAEREKKRALEAQVKTQEELISTLEVALLERMDKEGVDKSTGRKATVSISTSIKANIVDWDALCGFVKKHGYFHLFHRRVADEAARELFETKGQVPGLEPFTKRKVNIRTLS